MKQFQYVPTTYVIEIKETYFLIYTEQVSRPFAFLPGRVAQSVTCLATDATLTADTGVASSIPAQTHTFVEIDCQVGGEVWL